MAKKQQKKVQAGYDKKRKDGKRRNASFGSSLDLYQLIVSRMIGLISKLRSNGAISTISRDEKRSI